MQDLPPPPVITQEVRIVDSAGQPRIILSAKTGEPSIQVVRRDGKPAATIQLDKDDRPSVKLDNPAADGPTATLEVDDKGAHVLFNRPGGASSYLFLNNSGGSGVVLIDAKGARRASVVMTADGQVTVGGVDPAKAPASPRP